MKKIIVLAVVCVMAVANFASADTIRGINIDFVTIGNAGNTADTQVMNDGTTGYGAVSYNYRIGKYEVTNAQWNTFTAAAGAPTGNDDAYSHPADYTGAQQPTGAVSWYEAAQFCNYLTSGDKSKGAYLFSGDNTNPGNFLGIARAASVSTYGTTYVIPTENEWYKAAYHKNDGVTGNYWLYPTQSNSTPSNDLVNPDPGNNANFYQNGYTIGSPDYLTTVGEFENSDSAYGTFDQGGNVWEWNEALIGSNRGARGGSFNWDYATGYGLASSYRSCDYHSPYYGYYGLGPDTENGTIGIRIASVPEPATICMLGFGALSLIRRKK